MSAAEASAHVRCGVATAVADGRPQSAWSFEGWVGLVRGSLRGPPPDVNEARAIAGRFLAIDRYEMKVADGLLQLWPRRDVAAIRRRSGVDDL